MGRVFPPLTPEQEKVISWLERNYPGKVVNFRKAFARADRYNCIRCKCLECRRCVEEDIRNCEETDCPLWRARPYQD